MYFKNDPEFRTFRTDLRKNLTPAEASLWIVLKGSKIDGRKFRRQYGVGRYVLDFYCPSERLGIELDGDGHHTLPGIHYDNERKLFVKHFGIKVIRFENKAVFDDLEWVVERIRSNFGWRELEESTTPSAEAAATPP